MLTFNGVAEEQENVAGDAAAAESTAASDSTADSTAAVARKGDPTKGKKSYSVKCVACHMKDGRGGFKVVKNKTPDWRDAERMAKPDFDDAYLRSCITDGVPEQGMVSWAKQGMKDEEIDDLIAYIRTFSEAKGKKAKKK